MNHSRRFHVWHKRALSLAPMFFILALLSVFSGAMVAPAQAVPLIDLNGPGTGQGKSGVDFKAPNWINGITMEFGPVRITASDAFVSATEGSTITQIEVKLGDGNPSTTGSTDSPDGTDERIFAEVQSSGNVHVVEENVHKLTIELIDPTVPASAADFNAILRSLKYDNTSINAGSSPIPGNPDAVTVGSRTINFIVTEDPAATASAKTEVLVQYNEPPTVSVSGSTTYTEGDEHRFLTGGQVSSNPTIGEPNTQLIVRMHMVLSGRVDHGKKNDADQTVTAVERLYFSSDGIGGGSVSESGDGDSGTITVNSLKPGIEPAQTFTYSYNRDTGVMVVTGNARDEYWERVVQYLRYSNSSQDPTKTDRTVSFQAFDAEMGSDLAQTVIHVQKWNDELQVKNWPGGIALNGDQVQITGNSFEITDVDDRTWNGPPIPDQVVNYGRLPASEVGDQGEVFLEKNYFRIVLGATHGTLSLGSPETVGLLHFAAGSNNSSNMRFYGRQQDINKVLKGIIFTKDETYTTNALITFHPMDPQNGDQNDYGRHIYLTDIYTGNPQGGRPKISLDGSALPQNVFSSNHETTFVFGANEIKLTADNAFLEDIEDNIERIVVVISDPQDGSAETLTVAPGVLAEVGNRVKAEYDPESYTLTLTRQTGGSRQDLETVMRGVRYNHSDSEGKTGETRQINFTVFDATTPPLTTTAYTVVTFDRGGPELNLDPADTSGAGGGNYKKSYTPGGPAVLIIDPNLVELTDPDGKISKAILKLNTVENPDDEFLFVDVSGTAIIPEYDPVAGELNLTGVDTDANYLKVLKSVRYSNVATSPTQEPRVITITVHDEANFDEKKTTLTPDGNAPPTTIIDLDVARSSGADYPNYQTVWNQSGETSLTHTDATIDEADNIIQKLTVTIANNTRRDGVDEVISASVANTGITASYDQTSGVLTLQGPASEAEFITVLRKVKYKNTFSPKPNGDSRDFRFDVYGNSNNVITATALTTISIPPGDLDAGTSFINLDPDNSSGAGGNNYRSDWDRAGWNPLADTDATVDNTAGTLREITVKITNPQNNPSNEEIMATGSSQVTVSYDPLTGTLTLKGATNGRAPASAFQSVLRTVRYRNTASVVNGSDRIFSFQVYGGTSVVSATATLSVPPEDLDSGITAINLDPDNSSGAGGNDYQGEWNQEVPTRIVDTDAIVTNNSTPDGNGTLRQITVTIVERPDDLNEVLTATENAQVSVDYNSSSGVLVLQAKDGRAPASAFQNVLRSVRYQNTSSVINGEDRTFKFIVLGGSNIAEATSTITVFDESANDAGTSSINLDPDDSSGAGGNDYQGDWDQENPTRIVDTDAAVTNDSAPNGNGGLRQITVEIINRKDGIKELLTADGNGHVTVDYDEALGILLLQAEEGRAPAGVFVDVLRSVKYQNTSPVINGEDRTFEFTVFGGVETPPASATSTISIGANSGESAIDLDPDRSSGAPAPDFQTDWDQEGWTVLADGDAIVSNSADRIRSIEVVIKGRLDGVAEQLDADVSGTITKSFNESTGVLTLSGPANPSQFISVLRSVKYRNTSPVNNGTSRSFKFSVYGGDNVASATSTITVIDDEDHDEGTSSINLDFDDSSGAGGNDYQGEWNQEVPTRIVDTDAVVTNDSAPNGNGSLRQITVTIEDRQDDLDEVLTATENAQVSVDYNSSSGVLTLQAKDGRAPASAFQNVLRSVRYQNTSSVINGSSREFKFEVFGGTETPRANATSRISVGVPPEKGVTKLNLDPDDSSEAGGKDYFGIWNQSTANKIADDDATIENNLFDGTPAELTGITIQVLNPEDGNNEVLTAQVSGNVTASYDAAESTLTLSGAALADEYQTILRSVKYENTASNPTGTERHFRVSVYGGVNEPVTAISTLSTIPLGDIKGESRIDLNGPATGVNYERRWNKHNWNRLASPSAFVTNTANVIQKIEVTIKNPLDGLAEILDAKAAGAVTVEYDAPSHKLTLSGPATPAEFQNVVRSVRYENRLDSPNGDIREFEFVVFGGVETPQASAKTILDVDHIGGPNDGSGDDGDDDDDDDSNIPGDGGGSDGGNGAGDSDGSGGSSRSRIDLNGKGAGYNYYTTWVKGQDTNLTAGDATIIDSDGQVQKLIVSIEGGAVLGETIMASVPSGLESSHSNGVLVIQGPGSTESFIAALRSIRYSTSGVSLHGTTRRFRFELYGDVDEGDKLTSVAYTVIDTKDTGNKNNRYFTGTAQVSGNESEATLVYRIKNTTATPMHNILVTGQLLGSRLQTESLTGEADKGVVSLKWAHPPSMRRSLDKEKAARNVRWVIDTLEPGEVALLTINSPLRRSEYGDRLTAEWTANFPGTVPNEAVDPLSVR